MYITLRHTKTHRLYMSVQYTHTHIWSTSHCIPSAGAGPFFPADVLSLGQILCKIEMENVASSIVKGAIYFDLIKGALVGPHCLIL